MKVFQRSPQKVSSPKKLHLHDSPRRRCGSASSRSGACSTLSIPTLDGDTEHSRGPLCCLLQPLQVRFDMEANQEHEYEHIEDNSVNDDDIVPSTPWYSTGERKTFCKENKATVEAIRMVRKLPGNTNADWIQFLAGAYERTCKQATTNNNQKKDVTSLSNKIMASAPPQPHQDLPLEFIGLDKLIVAGPLLKDKKDRRNAILLKMDGIEQKQFKTAEKEALEIALACAAISQPSRVYAHYIAVMAAESSY